MTVGNRPYRGTEDLVAGKIHFVSLGCPKNTVDTERMVALAKRQGLCRASAEEADVIVVNTCGFIEPAKQESIDTILQMANHKHEGKCQKLVMAGCLSQRYPEQLAAELPEVDHFIGTADLGRLDKILQEEIAGSDRTSETDKRAVQRVLVGKPEGLAEAAYERELVGPPHSAYLKISEGCNRPCAFCSIPIMRGRQRSRDIPSLVKEAQQLGEQGVRELILVAQDTTAYGSDLPRGSADLAQLLVALDQVSDLRWIRVHYAYPSMIYPPLAETMASLERVVPYLDMPIQHVDDELLRRMRRGYTGERVEKAIEALREQIPNLWIRSTMLIGHPGETDQAHQKLLEFIEKMRIDHLGAFVFSPEENSPLDQKFLPKVDLPGPKRGEGRPNRFWQEPTPLSIGKCFVLAAHPRRGVPRFFPELASNLVVIVNKTYARNHVYGGLDARGASREPVETALTGRGDG
jgi:ribosomal protein S12 methylthiotransferase